MTSKINLLDKLKDFDGDEELAAEYSDEKTCQKSDSGYHCSCYTMTGVCHICDEGEDD